MHTILLCNFSGQPIFIQFQQSIANSVPLFNCCFCRFVEPPFQHLSETFLYATIYMVLMDLVQNVGWDLNLEANFFPLMRYFLKLVIHLKQLSVSWGDRSCIYCPYTSALYIAKNNLWQYQLTKRRVLSIAKKSYPSSLQSCMNSICLQTLTTDVYQ